MAPRLYHRTMISTTLFIAAMMHHTRSQRPAPYWEQQQVTVDAAGGQAAAQPRSQAAQQAASNALGACVDRLPDCAELAGDRSQYCADDPSTMLINCAKTCGTCEYRKLVQEAMDCEDTHTECANWARMGECDKNPKYMLSACTTSCGTCEAKQTGCRRANSTAPMAAPGGLNAMFERSLAEFPELEPVALSRPSSAEADDAPWVVQFDNLLTPEQAQAMVNACPNLERSLAGDQLSPVRTSTQCWCDDKEGCMGTEVVHDLTLRCVPLGASATRNALWPLHAAPCMRLPSCGSHLLLSLVLACARLLVLARAWQHAQRDRPTVQQRRVLPGAQV